MPAADFAAGATSLVIAIGETEATTTLTATQDAAIEGTEMIEITIASLVNAVEITPQKVTLTLLDDDIDSNDGFPDKGFIINETLFDPPGGLAGDANGDGTRDPAQDEFIEFINDSDQPIDLSGFTLFDETNLATNEPRHTFPAGTIIPPGGVYVLFGGGSPSGDFGTAQVGVSTSGNMNLSNAEDIIVIKNLQGDEILRFSSVNDAPGRFRCRPVGHPLAGY
ncbi:MAG: lamin tail domain-containing protein [Lewinellaceae bacterium]|nr:lamin tail domain-containing protein [Lewinellaceae bacterium]